MASLSPAPPKRKKSTEAFYYFVSVNYPFKAKSYTHAELKEDLETYRVEEGEFKVVCFEESTDIYFKKAKSAASNAIIDDFIIVDEKVPTNTILTETNFSVTICLDLIIKTDAEKVARQSFYQGVDEALKECQLCMSGSVEQQAIAVAFEDIQ